MTVIFNYIRIYSIPVTVTLLVVFLALGGDVMSQLLRYDSSFEIENEIWRLLTAHFIHLDWTHLSLNLTGLWVIWWLIGHSLKEYQWILVILILSIAITLGLKVWSPTIFWYVGLSGLLYGMLVVGAIADIRVGFSLNLFLLILVVTKITLEQFGSTLSLIEAGGSVVVIDAHLYGAMTGFLCGIVLRVTQKIPVVNSRKMAAQRSPDD
ncbi:MAG: rhombosortase [Gammaproteobacteria bacterium]|nr:rhombosortase [Gammaproteobacteria bacterium]